MKLHFLLKLGEGSTFAKTRRIFNSVHDWRENRVSARLEEEGTCWIFVPLSFVLLSE